MEDYLKLENSIKRGLLSNVYLIYGEEDYLKDLALKKITAFYLDDNNKDFNYDFISDPVDFFQ
ncbi:MAG: hypothetical protein SCK28_15570, partial [Bacillota bacterium]|nr:hypothetical protein [Bacillota bacterium]